MDTGLLWYDDDLKRPLPLKVADAVARYRERMSQEPTVCYVNPRQATAAAPATPRGKGEPLRVRLIPDERVRPNYFLVAEDTPEDALPAASDAPGPSTLPLDVPKPTLPLAVAHAAPRAARRAVHSEAHATPTPDRAPAAPQTQHSRRAPATMPAHPAASAADPKPAPRPVAAPPLKVRPVRATRPAAPAPASAPTLEPGARQSPRRAASTRKRAQPVPAPVPVPAATPAAPSPRARRPRSDRMPARAEHAPRVAAPTAPITVLAKKPAPRPAAKSAPRPVHRRHVSAPAVAQPSLFALLEAAPASAPAVVAHRQRRAS
jgi:hypothetical protein